MLLQSLILMSLLTSRTFRTCYQCCLLSSLLTYPYADVITIHDIDVITDIQDLLSHVTSVVCYHHSSLTHTADVITIPDIDVITHTADVITIPDIDVITDIQDLYYMLPVLYVIITPHLPIQLMLLQYLILMSLQTSRTFITCYQCCLLSSLLTHTADVITVPDIDVITDIQDLYYMLPVLSVIITPHLPIQLMLLQSLILMSLQTSRTFITCYQCCMSSSLLTYPYS